MAQQQLKMSAVNAAVAAAASSGAEKTAWHKFVEGKLFCWFLENATVWSICWLRGQLPEPKRVVSVDEKGNKVSFQDKVKQVIKNIIISYFSSVMVEVLSVYSLKVIDWTFFSHVPHFTRQRRSDSPFTFNAFRDWLFGNWWLQYFAGGVTLGVMESFWPEWWAKELSETKFDLWRFTRNFTLFRLVLDLVFYLGHRFLHVNETVYTLVHKRHHEHYTTNLRTNWHFGALDLFIESAAPIAIGMFVLRVLGQKMSRWELHLLQGYTAFHESGTHLGKPLNLISQHPILSIIYDYIFPQIDARAIEFHETHHNRRDVNYGITPWFETLVLKTAEFQKDILKAAAQNVPAKNAQ